jgi:hypothetical protein
VLGVRSDVSVLVGAHGFELIDFVFGETDATDPAQAQPETEYHQRGERDRDAQIACRGKNAPLRSR